MTTFRFRAAGLLAALLCAFAAGCSKGPPPIVAAEGVVLLNGQPLPHAEVQFVPMAKGIGGEYIATAVTDDQGRFKLMCNGQPGACACENKVTVSEGPIPEKFRGQSSEAQIGASKFMAALKNRPIPEKFGNLAQSPLSVTVDPGQSQYELKITR